MHVSVWNLAVLFYSWSESLGLGLGAESLGTFPGFQVWSLRFRGLRPKLRGTELGSVHVLMCVSV